MKGKNVAELTSTTALSVVNFSPSDALTCNVNLDPSLSANEEVTLT